MKKLRKCNLAQLNTGVSKCPIDFGRMKGAIITHHGHKLPADLEGEALEKLCHAAIPERAYGVVTFVEYAKDGGEAQTNATGYGGTNITGFSARTDTYTMDSYYPELDAAFTKTANQKYDVYFFDEDNILYGINDGTEILAGFPMSTIYTTSTQHPTSSDKATMNVCFCFENAKEAITKYDYQPLDFDPRKYTLGLVLVDLVDVDGKKTTYKVVESTGGADLTSTYGPLLADNANLINGNASAVTYNEDVDTLTITTTGDTTPSLKAPSVLYEAGVIGIEQA
jgi:hypothetical protein